MVPFTVAGGGEETALVATSELQATERVAGSAVRKLAARIEADGGIRETLKYVIHKGEKLVVDGNHRLQAARRLGIERVPAEQVSLPYKGFKTIEDLFHQLP
jgi:ParB-like chromosome segregation protein Spo0J